MLRIGDFSKLSRISIRMLRHYDEIGLLKPQSVDESTGYRNYSECQLPIANRITALKEMGFSLFATAQILHCGDDTDLMRHLLIKRDEVQGQADAVQVQLRLISSAIDRLEKGNNTMNYSVTLKTLPERNVASVRQVIPSYDQEGMLWNIYRDETADINLQCIGNTLAIFHDKGFKETDVDVEIQASVKGSYKNTERVIFKTVPPILMASCTYKGSYTQITTANEAVANWVKDNGYDFDGASFCIYHVSPHETNNPDEMVTEVCYPVKKA